MLARESRAVGSYLCHIAKNPEIEANKNQPEPNFIHVRLPLPGLSLNKSTKPTGALFIKNKENWRKGSPIVPTPFVVKYDAASRAITTTVAEIKTVSIHHTSYSTTTSPMKEAKIVPIPTKKPIK